MKFGRSQERISKSSVMMMKSGRSGKAGRRVRRNNGKWRRCRPEPRSPKTPELLKRVLLRQRKMIDLRNIDDVKALQSNLRASLDTPQGKEVVKWLEEICGWYDFSETDPNMILIKHGKRGVLATIKTLLKLSPEQIVALTNKEN